MSIKTPQQKQWYRETRELRKKTGICTDCGKPKGDSTTYRCSVCTKKDRSRNNAFRQYRKDLGLCLHCDNPSKTENCKECLKKISERHKAIRNIVLEKYGNKCACCGETEKVFLCMDHINNDGGKQRREDTSSTRIYNWIKSHDYPKTFQILCWNCNAAKHLLGVCPHQNPTKDNG